MAVGLSARSALSGEIRDCARPQRRSCADDRRSKALAPGVDEQVRLTAHAAISEITVTH